MSAKRDVMNSLSLSFCVVRVVVGSDLYDDDGKITTKDVSCNFV